MTLHHPNNVRESIYVYGLSDAGKSTCALDVIKYIGMTDSRARVFYGDTNYAWPRMRPSDGSADKIVQWTYLDEDDFPSWQQWAKATKAAARPDDWIVLDLASVVYDTAKSHYWDQRLGGELTLPDAMLKGQDDPTLVGGAHGANWDVINKYHRSVVDKLAYAPCNKMFIGLGKDLRVHPDRHPRAGKAINEKQEEFEVVRLVPEGKGGITSHFDSVLCAFKGAGTRRLTTIRERKPVDEPGREYLRGAENKGFVRTYLLPIAGWEL